MTKFYISLLALFISFGFFVFFVSAQQNPVLTGSLDSNTPASSNLPSGAQNVDIARINLIASGYDVFLKGIYLGTDVEGGLSNFIDIKIYDVTSNNSGTLLGVAPNQSANPYLVEFSNITIGNGMTKKFLIRAGLSSSAAGNIRLGFTGFTFSTQTAPTLSGIPVYGNAMTLPGATPTPTPVPSPTATPTPAPTPSSGTTPASRGFTSLSALGLNEGDTISAAGSSDPDIYIANEWGYKRLFLNPVIFGFYGHLGGFANVKNIASTTRDVMVTSGLFRNCETNDDKVYGVEITGEDTGTLHWINTTGAQAVADDPEFFKKVFCINSAEFSWYIQGSTYTSVSQVPSYSR
jgi:hypothetical protein